MVIKMPSVHHYHDTTRVKCMHAYASSSFSHHFIFTLKSFLLLTSSIIDWFYRKRNAPDKSPMRVSISITWGENFFAKDRQASNKMKSSLPFPIEIKDQFNPLSPSKIIRYSIDLSFAVEEKKKRKSSPMATRKPERSFIIIGMIKCLSTSIYVQRNWIIKNVRQE